MAEDDKDINRAMRHAAAFFSAATLATNLSGCAVRRDETQTSSVRSVSLSVLNNRPFDSAEIQDNFRMAMLPIVYERALKAGHAPESATGLLRARLPDTTDISVLRHQNSTAVVAFDRKRQHITVAYDATDELADMLGGLKFWEIPHALGGGVHSGVAEAQLFKDGQERTLKSQVAARVNAFAAMAGDQAVTLGFTGFSRGGAQATAGAADWMLAQAVNPGTTKPALVSLVTFGALAFGNERFIDSFAQMAASQRVDAWRVVAGDDAVPKHLTGEAWYGKVKYGHVGTSVFLLPDALGATGEVRIGASLTAEERDRLSKTNWHEVNRYADMLGVPDAKISDIVPPPTNPRLEPGNHKSPAPR
jgi:hypothetical protein